MVIGIAMDHFVIVIVIVQTDSLLKARNSVYASSHLLLPVHVQSL